MIDCKASEISSNVATCMILSDYAITQESLQNNQNKQNHTPSPKKKKPKHNTQTTQYASSSTGLVLLQKLLGKEERKICK